MLGLLIALERLAEGGVGLIQHDRGRVVLADRPDERGGTDVGGDERLVHELAEHVQQPVFPAPPDRGLEHQPGSEFQLGHRMGGCGVQGHRVGCLRAGEHHVPGQRGVDQGQGLAPSGLPSRAAKASRCCCSPGCPPGCAGHGAAGLGLAGPAWTAASTRPSRPPWPSSSARQAAQNRLLFRLPSAQVSDPPGACHAFRRGAWPPGWQGGGSSRCRKARQSTAAPGAGPAASSPAVVPWTLEAGASRSRPRPGSPGEGWAVTRTAGQCPEVACSPPDGVRTMCRAPARVPGPLEPFERGPPGPDSRTSMSTHQDRATRGDGHVGARPALPPGPGSGVAYRTRPGTRECAGYGRLHSQSWPPGHRGLSGPCREDRPPCGGVREGLAEHVCSAAATARYPGSIWALL